MRDASELLERDEDARPLAGGMSLIPMLKLRVITPSYLVDLNRLPNMTYVHKSKDEVRIGAMTRYSEVLEAGYDIPLLKKVISKVGDVQVRNAGTVGGSIANGDPSSDLPAALLATGGEVIAYSSAGHRVIKADDFYLGPYRTALKQGEIVTEVRFPSLEGYSSNYVKVVRRAGDYPLVSVATVVKAKEGLVEEVRIAFSGVADTPVREKEAEKSLTGKSLTRDNVEEAVSKLRTKPKSDTRGSSKLREKLMRDTLRSALLGDQ